MTLRPNLFGRISLAMYQGATALITPILPWHLKRRKNNAKEHPKRWRERLGHACQPRPQGQLVWINAVGLGEVMALRGLIAALHAWQQEALDQAHIAEMDGLAALSAFVHLHSQTAEGQDEGKAYYMLLAATVADRLDMREAFADSHEIERVLIRGII